MAKAPSIPEVQRVAYSLKEAATALHIGRTTLQRALSHGLVRFINMGAAIRIPAAEIERLGRDGLPALPAGYKRRTGCKARGKPRRKKRVDGD